eukprot:COSAG01_NODE_4976_length_4577_cov_4.889013_2_plen_126_part_00
MSLNLTRPPEDDFSSLGPAGCRAATPGPVFCVSNSTGFDRPAAAPRRPTSIRDRIHSRRHSSARRSRQRAGAAVAGGAAALLRALQRMAAPPRLRAAAAWASLGAAGIRVLYSYSYAGHTSYYHA